MTKQALALVNGLIEGFQPKFKSISKDCDRYFDALVTLSEEGVVETRDVIMHSSAGYLWIFDQYIAGEQIDKVEAVLKRRLTDRDFFGALFENDKKVMERLWDLNEQERVLALYRSAIQHRLKALQEESEAVKNSAKGTNAYGASRKWMRQYSPKLKAIIKRYEELLDKAKIGDPDIENIKSQVKAFGELCR